MKKKIGIIVAIVVAFALCVMGAIAILSKKPTIKSGLLKDEKYNSAILIVSPEEFEKAGFSLGDSLDIDFDNGLCIKDVPYYNGYYVQNGAPVVVAYPGFDDIRITYNNAGIWDTANLSEDIGVKIKLHKKGKYFAVQEALGQVYSFERADYESDEAFCNFRALSGGKLKKDFFYRGASPVDNSRNRAPYTDGILAKEGIQLVIDLADSAEDMEGYRSSDDYNSPYVADLYDNGKVVLLDMSSAYESEDYHKKVAEGMKQMMVSEGPVYIHCMEGKDRTGFVCFLLEALAGASYDEMRADYMITYHNYYGVDEETSKDKYDAIAGLYFDAFICYLHDTEDASSVKDADFSEDAAKYLIDGGMSEDDVNQLKAYITQ